MVDAAIRLERADAALWAADDIAPAPVAHSAAKRAFDIIVTLIALVFLAPLMIAAALAVWTESGGPILFRQRRTGLGGQPFVIYKFRSMTVAEDGPALAHATKNDARVTKVGAFLRKSSIDELPQLFNVLKGDMSLVGPRPHALGHDQHYAARIPAYPRRFRARPGLTGLAQVSGLRGEVQDVSVMHRRVEADIAYAAEWTFWLDVKIALKTVPLVLCDPQAY